jgi:hypothetical protein
VVLLDELVDGFAWACRILYQKCSGCNQLSINSLSTLSLLLLSIKVLSQPLTLAIGTVKAERPKPIESSR